MPPPAGQSPTPSSLFTREVQADVLVEAALLYKQVCVLAAIALLLLSRELVLR